LLALVEFARLITHNYTVIMKPFIYHPKPISKLRENYNRRRREGKDGFGSLNEFIMWYSAQDKKCHYCEIEEKTVQELVCSGYLVSKRFPSDHRLTRGRSRGVWLELDRKNPLGLYSEENCVLCCYFCNNDKSDIFTEEEYRSFRNNRDTYLNELLERKRQK